LGRLKISTDGLMARDRRVLHWAWERGVPLAFGMAGGYGHDVNTTVAVQRNTWAMALEYRQRWARRTAKVATGAESAA
jgi:acetoin utilization deacetylase AcuC-like enzyme